MNLDDVIRIARRLWPREFSGADVGWWVRRQGGSHYTCTVYIGDDSQVRVMRLEGDSVSGACTAMVEGLREVEASRGRPS